jgi:hypothetical protein
MKSNSGTRRGIAQCQGHASHACQQGNLNGCPTSLTVEAPISTLVPQTGSTLILHAHMILSRLS